MSPKALEEKDAQINRFKEAARALECDEDEAAFDEKLRRIAGQKPKPEKSTKEPE